MDNSSNHKLKGSFSGTATEVAFEVFVAKDTFKFNAAHFVAFRGYRERLHGHNYQVSVRLLGSRSIASDGYLIDFGNVKDVTKTVCKSLNEHFLCPQYSDVMQISIAETSVSLKCEDGSEFVFPRQDCAILPIVHATAEELGIYLYAEILNGLDASYLLQRGIHTMEVTVAEAPGQEAVFRLAIPESHGHEAFQLSVRQFVTGASTPKPCISQCCDACGIITQHHLRVQLEQLAKAMNENRQSELFSPEKKITATMLSELLANDSGAT